jgi:hypothetical protein
LRGRKIRLSVFAFGRKTRSEIRTPPASPANINPEAPSHAAANGLIKNSRIAAATSAKAHLSRAPDNHRRRSAVKFATLNVIKFTSFSLASPHATISTKISYAVNLSARLPWTSKRFNPNFSPVIAFLLSPWVIFDMIAGFLEKSSGKI